MSLDFPGSPSNHHFLESANIAASRLCSQLYRSHLFVFFFCPPRTRKKEDGIQCNLCKLDFAACSHVSKSSVKKGVTKKKKHLYVRLVYLKLMNDRDSMRFEGMTPDSFLKHGPDRHRKIAEENCDQLLLFFDSAEEGKLQTETQGARENGSNVTKRRVANSINHRGRGARLRAGRPQGWQRQPPTAFFSKHERFSSRLLALFCSIFLRSLISTDASLALLHSSMWDSNMKSD